MTRIEEEVSIKKIRNIIDFYGIDEVNKFITSMGILSIGKNQEITNVTDFFIIDFSTIDKEYMDKFLKELKKEIHDFMLKIEYDMESFK